MKKIGFFVCLTFAVFLCGCVQDMEQLEAGSPDAARKVLIAGTASDFKNAVIQEVIADLGTEGYYFKIIGLNLLAAEPADGFGAVVLVSAYRVGRYDGRVLKYIDAHPDDPRLIVFLTRGTDEPLADQAKPNMAGDAISTASRMDRVPDRAEELAALIKIRF